MKQLSGKIFHCWHIAFIVGCFLLNPVFTYSQKQTLLSIDGALYANSDNIAAHFSVNRNWLFNPSFGISAGVMFAAAPLDIPRWSNAEQTISYTLDNKSVKHLNIALSTFYIRPLIGNTGIYGNVSFLFEPIPFDYISIEKRAENDFKQQAETIGKLQFSKFSPGIFAEAGLFHHFKRGDKGVRLFIGIGYGWYDMYTACRIVTLDGQSLSKFLPQNNNYSRFTIRVM